MFCFFLLDLIFIFLCLAVCFFVFCFHFIGKLLWWHLSENCPSSSYGYLPPYSKTATRTNSASTTSSIIQNSVFVSFSLCHDFLIRFQTTILLFAFSAHPIPFWFFFYFLFYTCPQFPFRTSCCRCLFRGLLYQFSFSSLYC